MQLLCQQRNWILIAALLAGHRASSFIDIFFLKYMGRSQDWQMEEQSPLIIQITAQHRPPIAQRYLLGWDMGLEVG